MEIAFFPRFLPMGCATGTQLEWWQGITPSTAAERSGVHCCVSYEKETKMQRLQPEINEIASPEIKLFTQHILEAAPEYFWTVPSSSSGKYHPTQSNGGGGLIRHTKAVVYFAVKLCDVYSITGLEKDYVISACILHDILKYGEVKQAFTTKNHDYEGAMFVRRKGKEFGLDIGSLDAITGCIAWHMGKWTDMTGRELKKSFPGEYNPMQMVTHLADVISAQKNVSLSHIEG
jgi:putative nucleotidyltransferase with HDIG domain